MAQDKALSEKIFHNREHGISHLSYNRELAFFDAVKSGDEKAVGEIMLPLKNENLGVLSDDPVRNMQYHLTITIALITRFCIEGGLPSERAYTLSDIYIKQLDALHTEAEITELHRTLVFDYTRRMKRLPKEKVFSKPIILAIDYIEKHLHDKILLDDLAEYLNLTKTYLCRLFKKETGRTIVSYVKNMKIRAAENMLLHSDILPSEIGNYLSFSSQSHFIRVFKEQTGFTPKEYRNRFFANHFGEK